MKPTKRQITYLQSFNNAFKPVRKSNQDAIKVWLDSFIKHDKQNSNIPYLSDNIFGLTTDKVREIIVHKTTTPGPTMCTPVDCGIDMITMNQLNRAIINAECDRRFKETKEEYLENSRVNFSSIKNPERVEC